MKKPSLRFLRSPRFRYGGLSTLLLCVCLALLAAFNSLITTLESRHGWRQDYSFNAITTYSQHTGEILQGVTKPVHIYALFERGNEDLPLFELLNRYSAATPLITWEHTSASLNPTLLTRFKGATADNAVTSDSLIVHCEETGRFRVLSPDTFVSLSYNIDTGSLESARFTYEAQITSAIDYVTRDVIPVVYVAQGRGELDANTSAVLSDLLLSNHYDVRFQALDKMELTPADVLVFLAPVRDLTTAELQKVTDFASAGGSILFACDYSDPISAMPNYQALLRSYGFLPLDGLVVASSEEPDSYFEGNRTLLLPQMQSTDLTYDMVQGGTDTLLLQTARAFETPSYSDNSLDVAPLLLSGEKSYLLSLSSTSTSLSKPEGAPTGPFALALQARRFSSTGDVSRAVIIGSTPLLTNEEIHARTDAQEFIIRVVDFLLGGVHTDTSIMAKPALRPQLSADSVTMGSMLLVALPLSVLLAALLILTPRRHL